MQSKPHRSPWRAALWIIVAIAVLVPVGAFVSAQVLQNRILPGVTVHGTAVGGLTRADAAARVQRAVETYGAQPATVTINGEPRSVRTVTLGVTFNVEEAVGRAYAVGRMQPWNRLFLLPFGRSEAVRLTPVLNEEALQASLASAVADLTKPAIEPSLAVVNGAVTVMPGQNGVAIALDGTEDVVRAAAGELATPSIRLATTTTLPELSDADLAEAKTLMETMMSAPLALTAPGKRFTVSQGQIADWMTFSYDPAKAVSSKKEGIAITLDHAKVETYLRSLNEKVGVPAKAVTGYEADVLGEYAYKNFEGREIVLAETITQMHVALQELSPRQTELVIGPSKPLVTMATVTAPKPVGKVIAVDTAKQQLFAFEDGKLKFWTHVSTGLPGYETPLGEWKIYNKTAIQRMVGQGYNIPNVKWVMAYNGDYTLHTAYWHDDFGIPKSHGCTNMSERDAKWLYDWSEVGTPVVNYKS